jgi:hypothetical protein
MVLYAIVGKDGKLVINSKTGAAAYETEAQANKAKSSLKAEEAEVVAFNQVKTVVV